MQTSVCPAGGGAVIIPLAVMLPEHNGPDADQEIENHVSSGSADVYLHHVLSVCFVKISNK